MKNIIHTTILSLGVLFLLSCNNDDNVVKRTYIDFTVAGPSMNGVFSIEQDEDPNQLEASALYTAATSEDPSVVIITFNDYLGLGVSMILPGEKRLTELTDDHEIFGMSISSQADEITLISKTLSMDVTLLNLETSSIISFNLIDEMKGNFTGIMVYKYLDNGEEIEEAHIVEGKFEYAHY